MPARRVNGIRSALAPPWLATFAVATLLLASLSEIRAQDLSAASPLDPLLGAIEELESQHDAKCYSSASRFEDFVSGTPLSEFARRENVSLQKRVARRLWSRASQRAELAGASLVQVGELEAELATVLAREEDGRGGIHLSFPGGQSVSLAQIRASQYRSVAYSLRAILAVSQDAMLEEGEPLRGLSPESLDALSKALDAVTLAALQLADRDARLRSKAQISADSLRSAWLKLLPELGHEEPETGATHSASAARQTSLTLLDRIAESKSAAYRNYNELGERDLRPLLVFNIGRFYARRPVPMQRSERRALVAALEAELQRFADTLLEAGAEEAAGQPAIRAEHASAAVSQLIPHRIDVFEDVHVFSRLSPEKAVTLAAHDCDSFRDFGIHWEALQRAAQRTAADAPLPDPFAAEILAEAISQYGVLLLRVAGDVAGLDLQSARLQIADLGSAASEIQRRAPQHHARPEPEKARGRIVSATTKSSEAPSKRFFSDVSEASGVDFRHRSSRWLGEFRQKTLKTPPTFSGGGVAAEDVEGDGDMDLLFAGGGGNALFLNDGAGHFRDATREAGLVRVRAGGSPGEARNPIIADFDNDGLPEILISYANDDHQLFRNLGGARFKDVSSRAGLGGDGLVGGPVTVFDFDGDALLDIYVGYFGNYLEGGIPTFDRDNQNALPNKLFRNLGGLRFADVSKASGTSDTGWCQAVSHVDFDRDGRQDLVVANDYGRNALLRNLGDGKFENVAPELGVTEAFHSMNVGVADLNDDDHPDLYISNLATLVKDGKYIFPDVDTPLDFDLRSMAGMLIKESDRLYLSQQKGGKLIGYVPSEDVERGESSTGWAWDAEFLDFDHDGDDDLYLVNGTNDFNTFTMVYRRFGKEGGEDAEYLFDHRRESNVFFRNEDGALRNVSSASGADFAANSRSTAYLDFEGDGDLDIAVNNFHAKATLLRNDADKGTGHWIKLHLIGDPERGSNRDAIGAHIVATTPDGRRMRREVQGGSGYLSMNPKQQHLGLGPALSVDVQVTWPSGAVQNFEALAADRTHTLREGTDIVAAGSRGYAADPIP